MGAWGYQFDENDGAADWLSDFARAPSWNNVHRALTAFAGAGGYEDGEEAFAALEVCAAGHGLSSRRLPSPIVAWAKGHADGSKLQLPLAREAASLLRNKSELHELWSEGGDAKNWLATVDNLITRLK